jgi:acetoacetyl-CoA reductase
MSSRVALVTGGTRGIGAAIAWALKQAGHRVAVNFAGNQAAAKKSPARSAAAFSDED